MQTTRPPGAKEQSIELREATGSGFVADVVSPDVVVMALAVAHRLEAPLPVHIGLAIVYPCLWKLVMSGRNAWTFQIGGSPNALTVATDSAELADPTAPTEPGEAVRVATTMKVLTEISDAFDAPLGRTRVTSPRPSRAPCRGPDSVDRPRQASQLSNKGVRA